MNNPNVPFLHKLNARAISYALRTSNVQPSDTFLLFILRFKFNALGRQHVVRSRNAEHIVG